MTFFVENNWFDYCLCWYVRLSCNFGKKFLARRINILNMIFIFKMHTDLYTPSRVQLLAFRHIYFIRICLPTLLL